MSDVTPDGDSPNASQEELKSLQQKLLEDHIDEIDYQIFRAMNENGRISDTELAERVGLSRTAVRRRREKLKEEGIIDVLAVIVLQRANLAYADVQVKLDQSSPSRHRFDLIESLVDDELVYSLDSCMGPYDLFVRLWHSTHDELKSHVWTLLENKDIIEDYEIVPVIKTWKAWDKELQRPTEKE
jgi:Lrp/AsnC family transcriptional regulator, leucine-responsive regulatory protein